MTFGLSFGEILGDLLSDKDMKQKQLAEALNIPPSTLSNYFQGVCEPNFEMLKCFADYFGVTTDFLLDHRTGQAGSRGEDELLRVFRSLPGELQEPFIAQGKALLAHYKKSEKYFAKSP
jgi:transcriptional regulator with XRE-family HTH domain